MAQHKGLFDAIKLMLKNSDGALAQDMFPVSIDANGELQLKSVADVKTLLGITAVVSTVGKQELSLTGSTDTIPSGISTALSNEIGLYTAKVRLETSAGFPDNDGSYSNGFIIGINQVGQANQSNFQLYFSTDGEKTYYRFDDGSDSGWGIWLTFNDPFDSRNVDVDTGTEDIDTFADTEGHGGVRWDYVVKNGVNLRKGSIQAVWDNTGDTINHIEDYVEVGSTEAELVFNVIIDTNVVKLQATATSDNWEVYVKRLLV